MPRYVRILTVVPWLMAVLLLILIARTVGWAFFGVVFALILALSLLLALSLGRRSQRRKNR
jgi:ABC-type transport system involved in cytochrome bd biosynthesis fused ATPase/permease subunit